MSARKDIDVWMPLYVALWDSTTGHLTNEQDGAYGRLVRWYWKNHRPPSDDDQELASICRTDVKTWKKIRVKLAPFFTVSDGLWVHDKVERTMAEWKKKHEDAKDLASIAARARWSKERAKKDASSNAPSMREALLERCPSPSAVKVLVPTGHNTLNERDAPISPHEGQSAPALDQGDEDRKATAAAVLASLNIRKKG